MSQNERPRRLLVAAATGGLVALALWLVAATQLPNAGAQRNAMIAELKKINQQLESGFKQRDNLQKQLVQVQKQLAAISANTDKD